MKRTQASWSAACAVIVACGAFVSGVWAQQAAPARSPDGDISFTRPELPRFSVDTRMPEPTGRVIEVPADGDLQQALNDAQPGDAIVLQAGATYAGTFVLPRKDGQGWIVVRSSREDGLPPPGTRVTPADAKNMPKLVTNHNGRPALRAERGAHHYRFIGIEFTAAPEVKQVSAIVELTHGSTDLADVPSHFIFDRVYLHGRPDLNSQRGLTMNSRWTAVIDSWIDECHIHGFDSQAIVSWNGPGPFKIENNFLEGGSENIMFGGAKTTAESMIPSDIEIRRNHFAKNPAWAKLKWPDNWAVKNLFEIKNARRVLLEGNVFENCWAEGQTGFAFVLKSASPSQGQPWDTTSDLTIRYNRIINCLNGFSIARWSSAGPVAPGAPPTSRILIEHNVFERFGKESDFAASGRGSILFQAGGADITVRHNTAWTDVYLLWTPGLDNFLFLDNLLTPGEYGILRDGGSGWNSALGNVLRGNCRMEGNTIIRAGSPRARQIDPQAYPPGNLWFDSFEAAGVDPAAHRLTATSKAKGTATDGTDPGADLDAVLAATRKVRANDPY